MTDRPGIRPSRRGLIARLAVTLAVGAGATAGAVLVHPPSAAATAHSTEAVSPAVAAATATARLLLADFAVPPGSSRLPARPSDLPAAAVSAATESVPYQVTDTAWWRAKQPISALMQWVELHPEHGLMPFEGSPVLLPATDTITFSGRPAEQTLNGVDLVVTVYALGDGSAALRVVAAVSYVPSRPSSEVLPAADRLIVVPALAQGGKEPAPEITLTDRSEIARIEQVIDELPKAPAGIFNCPFDNGAGIALDFEDAQSTTLADVVVGVMGCERVQVSISGYHEPALSGGRQAAARIQAILGTHWDLTQVVVD